MQLTKKPSVTELLEILNKPALLKWANKLGLEGTSLDAYRTKRLTYGSDIHSQIEFYLREQKPFTDIDINKKAGQFFCTMEFIDCEKFIDHDLFTGRYDAKFKINGEVWIFDFKSKFKKYYIENCLQLAAYKIAEKCDHVAIVSVPDFKLIQFPRIEFNLLEQMIENLSKIYSLKQAINL
jgi:hypothetical protein